GFGAAGEFLDLGVDVAKLEQRLGVGAHAAAGDEDGGGADDVGGFGPNDIPAGQPVDDRADAVVPRSVEFGVGVDRDVSGPGVKLREGDVSRRSQSDVARVRLDEGEVSCAVVEHGDVGGC